MSVLMIEAIRNIPEQFIDDATTFLEFRLRPSIIAINPKYCPIQYIESERFWKKIEALDPNVIQRALIEPFFSDCRSYKKGDYILVDGKVNQIE